jgi:phage shock protein A
MTYSARRQGWLHRFWGTIEGRASVWLSDRETERPRVVYERAIRERRRQYAELKQAVAGILYMRNKLEVEIKQRSTELRRTHADIERAVGRGLDELAVQLIHERNRLDEDVARTRQELENVVSEIDAAKANLVRFRSEIGSLEREKLRALASFANARARRSIQEAIAGLSVDTEMAALDNVREQIARLKTESHLERELGDDTLRAQLRGLHEEARDHEAREELAALKQRLLPARPVEPAARVAAPIERALVDTERAERRAEAVG